MRRLTAAIAIGLTIVFADRIRRWCQGHIGHAAVDKAGRQMQNDGLTTKTGWPNP